MPSVCKFIQLSGINLNDEDDKVVSKLENSGKFTTRSMYRYITFSGMVVVRMMEIWKSKVPLKVQIFLWMTWHDRIQTAQQLRKRNWNGSKVSKYCGKEETMDRLLFQCPIGMVTWCWVRDNLGWSKSPTSIKTFQENCLGTAGGSRNNMLWWIIASVGWALWKTRNDLLFSNVIVKSPKQAVYKSLGFLKQWTKRSKEDWSRMEGVLLKLKEGLSNW